MHEDAANVSIELTPNPRSRKFITDLSLRVGSPVVYRKSGGAYEGGPLIESVLALDHVDEILLRGNILTASQDGNGSWYLLENQITSLLERFGAAHDPTYTPPPTEPKSDADAACPPVVPSPQLAVIQEILDETITPYIDAHGGALKLISFNTETHRLVLFYQGACSTCPSSFGMTLSAVQNVLRDQFDPVLTVSIANPAPNLYPAP